MLDLDEHKDQLQAARGITAGCLLSIAFDLILFVIYKTVIR